MSPKHSRGSQLRFFIRFPVCQTILYSLAVGVSDIFVHKLTMHTEPVLIIMNQERIAIFLVCLEEVCESNYM